MSGSTGATRPVTPVAILADRLGRLSRRLEAVTGLDGSLAAEMREVCALAAGLDPYLSRWSTPESPALGRLAELTRARDWNAAGAGDAGAAGSAALAAEMLSGHVEGQVLKMLVHVTRARRVLEIGLFTGYSALAMAEALPAGGRLVACEIDGGVAEFAREQLDRSPGGEKVEVLVGPALDSLAALAAAGEVFDLVFVDADKPGYLGYLERVLERGLLAPAGLVCVDNTLMQGQPWLEGGRSANGVAIAAFNRAVAEDPRVEQVIVPLRDGLTLIRRVDDGLDDGLEPRLEPGLERKENA